MRVALAPIVAVAGLYGAAFDDLFDFDLGEFVEPPGGHITGLLVAESVNAAPDAEASRPRRPLQPINIELCERLDPDMVRVSVTGGLDLDSSRATAQNPGSSMVEWVFEARRAMCRQTLGVWRGVRLYPPWGGLHNATHFLEHWGGPGMPPPESKPDVVAKEISAAFVGLQYGFQPNSYFHFIANGLELVLRSQNLDRDLPLITNGSPRRDHFTTAIIDFLGLRDRVVFYDRQAVWHIGLALIPRHTMLSPYAEDLRRVRRSLLAPLAESAVVATRPSPPLAVVVRRDGSRSLANGRALEATVEEWGETAVHLSSMPFAEQRRIYARASLVVGTCGAGMTNLLLSRARKVVEVQPASERLMTLYAELAHRALDGAEYHILGVRDERGVHRAEGFLAPIPELRRVLGLSQDSEL